MLTQRSGLDHRLEGVEPLACLTLEADGSRFSGTGRRKELAGGFLMDF